MRQGTMVPMIASVLLGCGAATRESVIEKPPSATASDIEKCQGWARTGLMFLNNALATLKNKDTGQCGNIEDRVTRAMGAMYFARQATESKKCEVLNPEVREKIREAVVGYHDLCGRK